MPTRFTAGGCIRRILPWGAIMSTLTVFPYALFMCGDAAAQHAPDIARQTGGLRFQLQFLKDEIRRTHTEADWAARQIAAVQSEMDELIEQLEALSPDADPDPPPRAKPGPREVKFRLPLAHVSSRPHSALFVCEEGRVTWIDVSALADGRDRQQLREAADRVRKSGGTESGRWLASRGAFDSQYEVKGEDGRVRYAVWIVRKAGYRGETAGETAKATSEFSRKLATLDPRTTRIELAVRSDSFDLYRPLRSRLFEQGFDVNWVPLTLDQRFQLGVGAGISN